MPVMFSPYKSRRTEFLILSMPITVMLLLVLSSDERTQWLARIISKTGKLP